eukprot:2683755-Rhodomonas_salina.1
MAGTDIRQSTCVVSTGRAVWTSLRHVRPGHTTCLSCYALATPCPVLTHLLLPGGLGVGPGCTGAVTGGRYPGLEVRYVARGHATALGRGAGVTDHGTVCNGTQEEGVGPEGGGSGRRQEVASPLSSYACAMRCPVL